MGLFKDQSIPPEIKWAHFILMKVPRVGTIEDSVIESDIKRNHAAELATYSLHKSLALQQLKEAGSITITQSDRTGIEYSLTNIGRIIQDNKGFIRYYKQNMLHQEISRQATVADGKKKIFDNRIKYLSFLVVIAGAAIGIWGKLTPDKKDNQPTTQEQHQKDSAAKLVQDEQRTTRPTVTAEKKKAASNASRKVNQKTEPETVVPPPEQNVDNPVASNLPKVKEPIDIIESDNIEFKLVRVMGNRKTQSVTFTMLLTTSAANWYINSHVRSIIDVEGNEYRLSSYTLGASNYSSSVHMVTGVPIKCTYTFKGVLPDVKVIKLFKYDYTHSWGEPFHVEFRDIQIDWR